ncbi:MAG: NAD-dependent epimerase/dehydratase family protein, partial [Planctomycetota bacterium]
TKAELPEGVTEFTGDRGRLSEHGDVLNAWRPDVVLDMFPLSEHDAVVVQDLFRSTASRVVALSSQDVYRAYGVLTGKETGPPDPVPLTEDAPLRQNLFPYRGMSERLNDYEKILVEQAYLGDPELPGTILRLPMVYGPRDYQHRLFPYLKRMDDGRPAILLSEKGAAWRCSRGYVENMAHAIALAVGNDPARGEVFNVADETTFTEREWVERIGEAVSWGGEILPLPEARLPSHLREDIRLEQDLVVSSSKIRHILGYKEQVTLADGIRNTVQWERENPPPSLDLEKFDYPSEDLAIS